MHRLRDLPKVCCGEILSVDERGKAPIAPVTEFGWAGCWACQHCLAVCPTGAISFFDHSPEDSLPAPKPEEPAPVLDALMTSRRACRRYLQKDVPMETIEEMFAVLQNLPTGSNKRKVGYTFLDREQTRRFHDLAYARMEELASCCRSCLELAAEQELNSLAFCCISTGEFHFPDRDAAEIAVKTVTDFLRYDTSIQKAIFNVFKDIDAEICRDLLG